MPKKLRTSTSESEIQFGGGAVGQPGHPEHDHDRKCCCVVVCCGNRPETPAVPPNPPEPPKSCGCGSCVFEVRLQRLRYLSGSPGFADRWAELSFTAHVDGNMCNYPSGNGSYIRIGKKAGGYWPGWMPINIRVGVIEVKCGCTRSFDLMTEMVENPAKEGPLTALFEGGRPWGASEPTVIALRCGAKPAPVLQDVQLELGGNRTEDMKVRVEYRVSQISTCSCDCPEK